MKEKRTQNVKAEIDFFDKIAEEGHFDTISEDVYELIFNKIDPYFGKNALEAGCGSGSFGLRIRKRKTGINITGIDISQKFVDLAQSTNAYSKLVCGNLEERGIFKEGEFDTIICPYILHHFPDMEKVVKNFFYWLKPKGSIIIIDPNGSNFILQVSYLLRLFMSRFIDASDYASINEAHKSIPEFLRSLSDFEICSVGTFRHKSRLSLKLYPFSLLNIFAFIQKTLLIIYDKMFFIKFRGSDLIIIAKK